MKVSLSYYITLFVIKLKGVKKIFSQDPIDYKKLRKEDIHEPKGAFFSKSNITTFPVKNSLITEVKKTKKLVIFIHGGAFISGPSQMHWDALKEISKQTEQTIWMCDYPKAPEHDIVEISNNIDAVFNLALEQYEAKHITLIGDSVGGTLITALTQRLILNKRELPRKIILISPVMDATLSNSDIEDLDKIDPMLSKAGVLSAKKMCAQNHDLNNPLISPIYGSFKNFPHTTLFIATNDITYADQQLMIEKMNKAHIDLEVIIGENMPHIWPLLPVMAEAKTALKQLIEIIK